MSQDSYFSRPVFAAMRLGEMAEDRHRFLDKHVLLTAEPGVLETENGRDCFLTSLQILIRICPNVSVALPQGFSDLAEKCQEDIAPLLIGPALDFIGGSADFHTFDAILCVGSSAKPELPWTVINSNGWLARVSSGSSNLSATCSVVNPISALAAAALGVGEVFKRLINLRPGRGKLMDGLVFNLYNYQIGEADPGPALPDKLESDLLLVGGGAIGNGLVHLLRKLPLIGRVWIVDKQTFGPENWGTSILLGPSAIGIAKANALAKILSKDDVKADGYAEDFDTFSERLGNSLPYPKIVLTALDNIDARHEVQRLWPDLIIDGAISDFACQASRHAWNEDVACLLCLFREPTGELAESAASKATGLTAKRALQELDIVTQDDVERAPIDKKEWLGRHIGHKICSVIEEGLARQLSSSPTPAGFQPSVPFVACLSASMMVAELVKSLRGWPTTLQPRFQFDVLRGPALGLDLPQERRSDCICMTRRHNIDVIRRNHFQDV